MIVIPYIDFIECCSIHARVCTTAVGQTLAISDGWRLSFLTRSFLKAVKSRVRIFPSVNPNYAVFSTLIMVPVGA